MIKGKFKVIKTVYHSEGFNIYGVEPLEMIEGKAQLNRYHNATIKTSMDLTPNHIYTLTLNEHQDKYGIFYSIIATGLDFASLEDITPELHLDLLRELTSVNLAENIHKAYPNFIHLVLTDRVDEIDVNNIKGVKYKLLAKFVHKIKTNCIMFMLLASYPHLQLTPNECRSLANRYGEIENIKEALNENPYDAILTYTDRTFYKLDKILKDDYHFDHNRIKWLIATIIEYNTYDGSTYISTNTLVDKVRAYDSEVVEMLVDIVKEADDILYDADKDVIQYKPHYDMERKVANFIKLKIKQQKPLDWKWEDFKEVKDGVLTDEQQGALKMVCDSTLSMLIGYGGTGKTSTVKAILQMLEAYDQTYILLAPTGKASQRLAQQTGRKASTIHRATLPILNNKGLKGDEAKGLLHDWIIIDEMSMVSLDVMQMVIDAVDDIERTRFLFIGDSGQIPSIGMGAILRDCIESNIVPITTLTHCFRFKEGGASYVAECMRRGEPYLPNDVEDFYTMGANQDYTFIKWNGTREQIVGTYVQALNTGLRPQDVSLLIPYNKYDFGTLIINNNIQSIINPIDPWETTMKSNVDGTPIIFHKNDMVLVTKNNYKAIKWQDYDDGMFDDMDIVDIKNEATGTVYNGQIGVITQMVNGGMVVKIEGESFVFLQEDLQHLRLGYALSVHKFQGSQAKYIINVIIPQHSNLLSRELCYTAQTRFSKKLIEIGTVDAINYAMGIAEQDNRRTRLKEFLLDG